MWTREQQDKALKQREREKETRKTIRSCTWKGLYKITSSDQRSETVQWTIQTDAAGNFYLLCEDTRESWSAPNVLAEKFIEMFTPLSKGDSANG